MWVVAFLFNFLEISFGGAAQGTTYHVRYQDAQQRHLQVQVDSILADIDKSLSIYRTDSEISTFNQFDDFKYQSPHFYPVLKRSHEIWRATGGAFDPTVMPLTDAYRKGRSTGRSWMGQVDSLMQYVGFQYISFDAKSVHKRKENVRLDFDAIAQGYAVDVISRFLEAKGITEYRVNIGGGVRCNGKKGWAVDIDDPRNPGKSLRTMKICNRAMSTSGNYNNFYQADGRLFSSVVSPFTGVCEPDSLVSATIFAADAMTADAYATACLALGLEKAKKMLIQQKGLEACLIYKDEGRLKVFMKMD